MKYESAQIYIIEIGAVVLIFLFIPFVIALTHLPRVWRDNRGNGVLLGAVLFWTMLLYGLLLGTFAGLVLSQSQLT